VSISDLEGCADEPEEVFGEALQDESDEFVDDIVCQHQHGYWNFRVTGIQGRLDRFIIRQVIRISLAARCRRGLWINLL